MASGDHDDATLRRYSDAQARLEHAGGWAWRDRAAATLRGLGFARRRSRPRLDTFSGGELTRASLGRALTADPDLLLLDEPTNHLDVESLEWLERELTTRDAAVVLVAHDRWFLEAVTTAVLELGGPKPFFFDGPWRAWRMEKAARASAVGHDGRPRRASTSSASSASSSGSATRRARRSRRRRSSAQIARLEKERKAAKGELEALTARRRSLGFEFLKPARTGRIVLEASGLDVWAGDKELLRDAELVLERGEHVALVGPERLGQDDAARDDPRRARSPRRAPCKLGHGVVPAYFSQHDVELPKQRHGARRDGRRAPRLPRPQAQSLLGKFLFSGWEAHEKQVVGALGRGAPPARARARRRVGSEPARPRRADEPPRPREPRGARGGARGVPRHGPLRLARPRDPRRGARRASSRSRTSRLRSYDGAWADLVRERRDEPARRRAQAPRPRKERPARRPGPTELEQVEAQVAQLERQVAELEGRLAEDWTNMDTLAAHTAAREELQSQLARWEELFEASQVGGGRRRRLRRRLVDAPPASSRVAGCLARLPNRTAPSSGDVRRTATAA